MNSLAKTLINEYICLSHQQRTLKAGALKLNWRRRLEPTPNVMGIIIYVST